MMHILPGEKPVLVLPPRTMGWPSQPTSEGKLSPKPIYLCQRPEGSCSRKKYVPPKCSEASLCRGKLLHPRGGFCTFVKTWYSITAQDIKTARAWGIFWSKLFFWMMRTKAERGPATWARPHGEDAPLLHPVLSPLPSSNMNWAPVVFRTLGYERRKHFRRYHGVPWLLAPYSPFSEVSSDVSRQITIKVS